MSKGSSYGKIKKRAFLRVHRKNRLAPGTPGKLQRNQQMKFGMMTNWLSRINSFLKLGCRKYDSEMSPFNAAVRYNLEKAVTGDGVYRRLRHKRTIAKFSNWL
jgi:hypothetical protein